MDTLTRRVQSVVEGILENESLTDNLDDEAGQVLLDWGIDCGKRIAHSTAGLSDEDAEEAMYGRLRAMRRLMRLINRQFAPSSSPETSKEETVSLLTKLVQYAEMVYDTDFVQPDEQKIEEMATQWRTPNDDPLTAIIQLRHFIEGGDIPVVERQSIEASVSPGDVTPPAVPPQPEPSRPWIADFVTKWFPRLRSNSKDSNE